MSKSNSGDEQADTSDARGYEAFLASLRQTSGERISRRQQFKEYFEHPKGKIEALTLVAVVIYAGFTYRLMQISQDQLSAMHDEQRPWIKVSIVPDKLEWWSIPDVHVGRFGGSSPIVYVENVGHSPAFGVRAGAWAYITGSKEPLDEFQRRVCGFLSNPNADATHYGSILFPGDKINVADQGIGKIGFGLNEAAIKNGQEKTVDGKQQFSFVVCGCADYVFGFPPKHHQSFFAYDAYRMLSPSAIYPNGAFSNFAIGDDVPTNEMRLFKEFANNSAN